MAKKTPKEVAKILITCNDLEECSVEITGDRRSLTAALASLIATEDEANEFHSLIHLAMSVVMFQQKEEKAKSKKKAAPKKKANAKRV